MDELSDFMKEFVEFRISETAVMFYHPVLRYSGEFKISDNPLSQEKVLGKEFMYDPSLEEVYSSVILNPITALKNKKRVRQIINEAYSLEEFMIHDEKNLDESLVSDNKTTHMVKYSEFTGKEEKKLNNMLYGTTNANNSKYD